MIKNYQYKQFNIESDSNKTVLLYCEELDKIILGQNDAHGNTHMITLQGQEIDGLCNVLYEIFGDNQEEQNNDRIIN